ncbi:MAG TPA: lipoprotein insertase outer membrane protein LolB [Casimicrobiaceae bacterium]|jgi:outer membrane lipoprotein LolB
MRAALAAFALLLASCATIAPREAARVADAAALAAPFDVQGRLSARRGAEGGAATFTWHHEAQTDRVELATPLGQTLARLTGGPDGVNAEFPDGRLVDAPGWDALTARVIGVPVPVAGLTAWLRGYAHAGSPATMEPDARGRPSSLRQDGWEIVYTYPDDTAQRASRLTLRYEQGEPMEVRIVVDRWQ